MTRRLHADEHTIRAVLFDKLEPVFRNWWFLLTAGLILIGTGICVIYSPFRTYLTMSWILPPAMVITGVTDMLFAWTNRHSRRWIWWLLAGMADTLVGIYLFDNQLVTILLLPVVIGLWTWYKALMGIGEALHIRNYKIDNWHRLLFAAIIVMVMAALLLSCQYVGLENIFLLSGLALAAAGFFRVYWALRLRSFAALFRNRTQSKAADYQEYK